MRSILAAVYLIWVGWLIRKTGADEQARKWALAQFDQLAARAVRAAEAERAQMLESARVLSGRPAQEGAVDG